ncbi:uncharacterized protein N7459_000666 [Penicillium hispanicum]|uniref:uncharacterized protein n=1 Tax=Penicillium hispanicum TaxID=1080232 RepID=UPI00254169C7|nr:uncharacterized protein N7459_000666 [Penicillium hispanicum]KAJ5594458.1 hypothetical protein N7459_000666 [Penicillium hispanicum]
MASNKDMRRADLVIPYVDPPASSSDPDMSSTMSSTMPMAAMFTRNRMIGWVSFIFSLQTWLAESPEQKKTAATPAYMSVGMSLMALVVVRLSQCYYRTSTYPLTFPQTYFPLFLPSPAPQGASVVPSPSPSP